MCFYVIDCAVCAFALIFKQKSLSWRHPYFWSTLHQVVALQNVQFPLFKKCNMACWWCWHMWHGKRFPQGKLRHIYNIIASQSIAYLWYCINTPSRRIHLLTTARKQVFSSLISVQSCLSVFLSCNDIRWEVNCHCHPLIANSIFLCIEIKYTFRQI